MGIVVPETCSAYKKNNKIISGIYLVLYSSVITMTHGPINIRICGHLQWAELQHPLSSAGMYYHHTLLSHSHDHVWVWKVQFCVGGG